MIINANPPDEQPPKPQPEVPPPTPTPERPPSAPPGVSPPPPDVIFPGKGEPLGIPTGPGPDIPMTPTPPEIV